MVINRCAVCGSRNLRADRALAGRIICNQCGTPAGSRNYRINKRSSSRFYKGITMNIVLLLFLIVIIIIAIG